MMNVSKTILRTGRLRLNITSNTFPLVFSTDAEVAEEKIEIPKRIPRGPTDVLRALESTVGRDPTAGHYKYHDDPYLVPLSGSGKRIFAMAQEAGRKAAHWVRKEHADLFQHKEMDPIIEAFVPPMVYTENSEVAVSDLEKLIKTGQVSDASIVYNLLKKKGEVEEELEQGVLELLCYHNGEDGVSDEFIEEKWFRQANKGKEIVKKTWKDGDLAEQIFINMQNKTPESYCAIIQGMIKYHQIDRAMQLFEEAQKANMNLNTNTYNALLSAVNAIKESFDMRWSLVAEFLSQMKNGKLQPNLGTLNAVLHSLSSMGNPKVCKQYALSTLSEFKQLGIEPSLASWYYILLTFCKDRGPVSTILHDIMDYLENKEHPIRDVKDANFFVTAMETARHHLNDVGLARRIDQLLHYGDNYDLIGDSFKESVYFRHYFVILCNNIPLEEFMSDYYNKLVPHVYVPEVGIMNEILKHVDVNGAVEYIPRMWSDVVVFDQAYRENLVDSILNTMVTNEELTTPELKEAFAKIAWDIYSRATNEERVNRLKLTGDLLGRILSLLAKNKEFDKACTIMDKLDKNQQTIPGVPKIEALSHFVDLCIEEKLPSRAIACIQYCADCGFPEASSLAVKLHKQLNLDEVFLGKLSKIVGDVFGEA